MFDPMIIGDPKRVVWVKPDQEGQARRSAQKGALTKHTERASREMAEQWKSDFERRVQARLKGKP